MNITQNTKLNIIAIMNRNDSTRDHLHPVLYLLILDRISHDKHKARIYHKLELRLLHQFARTYSIKNLSRPRTIQVLRIRTISAIFNIAPHHAHNNGSQLCNKGTCLKSSAIPVGTDCSNNAYNLVGLCLCTRLNKLNKHYPRYLSLSSTSV